MKKQHTEENFEIIITEHLLNNGYILVDPKSFDKKTTLFTKITLDFIKKTQPKSWEKLSILHGEKTENIIIQELCRMLENEGSLSILRHGFKCYGQRFYVAYFKPAHNLNSDTIEKYNSNAITVTRQLRYSEKNDNELDLCLSINGIPVITAELKNPMTNSTVENAKKQYMNDRDPREKIFEYKKRTLVHFAVDTDLVFMTTKLSKNETYFLPFNKGYNGGAGNPPCLDNYKTSYLWEEVWQKDSLLDIFARFMHLQIDEKFTDEGKKVKKETIVFPRYHQLTAVRLLEQKTKEEGVGNNYLIEHSAGSGKSNTLGWLAHRLSNLHNEKDKRIFNSVVVITDRVVLDRQLQNTIYQFEHKMGVVEKIDKDSLQLAKALESNTPIIITTLQKFPFVTEQIRKLSEKLGKDATGILPDRNFAVLIDEAHSSQSGEAAIELKGVLGGENLMNQVRETLAQYGDETTETEEVIFRRMAERGKLKNISFYAFTATPKHKTLGVFGRDGASFHKYSMRQAIEEGFIMDVLKSYTTYKTYYELLKKCEEDPNVEKKKAAKALARFMKLHPHNISQKTEVIIDHFYTQTMHKLGGKAKAMVVTGGRLEAVRFKQSFDKYIKEKGYTNIKTLVAFSGIVVDDKAPEITYTEVDMNNGIKESELPEQFATQSYQVLLVAEKYQTGFDQPLLHTMYVNKKLGGIQAVQTLSRLNRMHRLKEDTFILDFVNDREEIYEAFKQFYDGAIMGEEPDSGKLYELESDIFNSEILTKNELDSFSKVFFKQQKDQLPVDHKLMSNALEPSTERFTQKLNESNEEAELIRTKLISFRNLYSYLSQIIPFQDSDLEKLYSFIRHLLPKLPRKNSVESYNFDDSIRLKYYRLQKESEGSISLDHGETKSLKGPTDVGTGKLYDGKVELSSLIDILNDRFGTSFSIADQLFFDQVHEAALEDINLEEAAQSNSFERFELLFNSSIEKLIIDRMDLNMEIFEKFMNETDFHNIISPHIAEKVYKSFRKSD